MRKNNQAYNLQKISYYFYCMAIKSKHTKNSSMMKILLLGEED